MAANDFLYARIPQPSDLSCKNASGSDIAAGNVVTLDPANPVSATQSEPGIKQGTTDDFAFGIAIEAIANGKSGRVARGSIAQAVASAAITAGAVVQADASGKVKTQGAGKAQVGQALTAAAADGDKILVALAVAKNA